MGNLAHSAAPADGDPVSACVYQLRPLNESEVYTIGDAHRYYAQRCGPGRGTVAGVMVHAVGLVRLAPWLERLQRERRTAFVRMWVLPVGGDHYLISFGLDADGPGEEVARYCAETAETEVEHSFAAALLVVANQLAKTRRDWVARGRPIYRITYDCGPDPDYLAAVTRPGPLRITFGPN